MIMGEDDNSEEHEKAAFQVTGLPKLKQVCAWRFLSWELRHAGVRVAAAPTYLKPTLSPKGFPQRVSIIPLEHLPPR